MTSTFDQIGLLLDAFEGTELQAYVCGERSNKPTPVTNLLYSLSFKWWSPLPYFLTTLTSKSHLLYAVLWKSSVISDAITFCTFKIHTLDLTLTMSSLNLWMFFRKWNKHCTLKTMKYCVVEVDTHFLILLLVR